ncbi:MAG: class I SAM-dependent methyltransferase, partial [Chitinophagaceae bacterium]|nr:class I SAM-dependent methyltransferase [Chitinophagaceae bacterium]
YRVLKPGGKLVVLEFSRPKQKLFKGLYNFYTKKITPGIGKMVTQNSEAYKYLTDSVQAFPEREKFIDIMNKAGYKETNFKPLTMGICCIYTGVSGKGI